MIALTEFFDAHIWLAFPEPMDELDREFRWHLSFVWNQVLQALRKTGWSKRTLERAGKLLYRLWKVHGAYKAKKAKYTLPEWIGKVALLGKEADKLFG